MILLDYQKHVRERIGSPSLDVVSDLKIGEYLASQLAYLAGELNYQVLTEPLAIQLQEGVQYYAVPPNLAEILWVENNGIRLEPHTVHDWDLHNLLWRSVANGPPLQFAYQSRQLILYPPPDSGSIATDPYLQISYIAGPDDMQPEGAPALSESAAWLLVNLAAAEYLGMHPSDENTARLTAAQMQIKQRMPNVLRQARNALTEPVGPLAVYSRRTLGYR